MRRLAAALWVVALSLFIVTRARAAADWRPALEKTFRSLDTDRSADAGASTLAALKPLWEVAPSRGGDWALSQSAPIIQELEIGTFELKTGVLSKLTPETLTSLSEKDQRDILRLAARRTTIESQERAETLLREIENEGSRVDGQGSDSLRRLIAWKRGLLLIERRRLYLDAKEDQLGRLDSATHRVNTLLWAIPEEKLRELVRVPQKTDMSMSGKNFLADLTEASVVNFVRDRKAWPGPNDRMLASALKRYSPGLDPNRFFLLDPRDKNSKAILDFNPSEIGVRHGLSVAPGIPMESFLFVLGSQPLEPTYSPDGAHVAIHEGFHGVEPLGVRERLISKLREYLDWEPASALSHILIEGLTELLARRATASALEDGAAGKSAVLREIHDNLQEQSPRPEGSSFTAWVDHWLAPDKYSPYVQIARTLERSLGGLWELEDLVYRGNLTGIEHLLLKHKKAFNLLGPQLRHAVHPEKDRQNLQGDDFELSRTIFGVLNEIFFGENIPFESVRAVSRLVSGYHGQAYELRSVLRPAKQKSFTSSAKNPALRPEMTFRAVRMSLEEAASQLSWMPRWLWRPIVYRTLAFFDLSIL